MSAFADDNFSGAGKAAGMEMWRIENKVPMKQTEVRRHKRPPKDILRDAFDTSPSPTGGDGQLVIMNIGWRELRLN
jgi:hypothetical protein